MFSRDFFNPSAVSYNASHSLFVARHLKVEKKVWISSVVYGWLRLSDKRLVKTEILLHSSQFSLCRRQNAGAKVVGAEDPRLFWYKSHLYMMDHRVPCTNHCHTLQPTISRIVVEGDVVRTSFIAHLLYDRDCPRVEKNWMPFDYHGTLYAVRAIKPHETIVKLDASLTRVEESYRNFKFATHMRMRNKMSGGSPIVHFTHGSLRALLGVIHEEKNRIYKNFPILLDPFPPFSISKLSNKSFDFACRERIPVRWKNSKVCFASGLFVQNHTVYVTYGSGDAFSYIWSLPIMEFMSTYFP